MAVLLQRITPSPTRKKWAKYRILSIIRFFFRTSGTVPFMDCVHYTAMYYSLSLLLRYIPGLDSPNQSQNDPFMYNFLRGLPAYYFMKMAMLHNYNLNHLIIPPTAFSFSGEGSPLMYSSWPDISKIHKHGRLCGKLCNVFPMTPRSR